ncbi:Conserved DNA-binding protein YbaB [Lentzea fradiae]|uniref:Conserved DNA-binding protein YbaB n=2 Tax=Lentzea fradiae TaxID=200378 RepID=A0A1G7SM94_9PSEU|nr:Conserved DNA-binding protein YbaB [Lentzea fradiae]
MRSWDQQIQAKLRQADQITQAAREVRVTQRSQDGAVSVTVDSGGNVTALDLTEAALRKQPAQLSAEILGLMRSAQAQIATRMREAMEPVLGGDTATMGAIVGGLQEKFPPPPEPPAPEPPRRGPQPTDDDDFQGHNWARDQKGW